MKTFVKENTWLDRSIIDCGWGNGYVVIPNGHPLHGKNYDKIHEIMPWLEVNGGLTFSENADDLDNWDELPENSEGMWVVGFDTAHAWDTLRNWSKRDVELETEKLKEQLMNFQNSEM